MKPNMKLVSQFHTAMQLTEAVQNTKYWVLSDGDSPDRICFEWNLAIRFGVRYIDGFNYAGTKTISFMLDSNGDYTSDF